MSRRRIERAVVLLLGCAGVGVVGCERPEPKVAIPRPPVVTFRQPIVDYVTDYEDFTGRIDAIFTIEVRARVSGYLEKVRFKDGDEVKQDDLLFEIDARPYKAELDRTEAALAQSEAHLKRLEADFRRATNLMSRGSIGREEFDKISGDRSEAEAAVGIARAQYDMAKLNMGFTRITAPISGRLSRRLVDPGNLVKADETMMTTIVSLDPMYVNFDVDERTLLRLRRLLSEGKIKSRQQADIPVFVGLSDEDDYTRKGLINFSDNRVDPGTGTLRVRASVPNPAPRVLSPGMFAKVRLPIGDPRKSILIDEQALGTEQDKKYIYVVNDKSEVEYRPVKVGKLDDGMRVILEGLNPTERVVVNGLQRVRPGLKVEARPAEERPPRRTAGAPNPAGGVGVASGEVRGL